MRVLSIAIYDQVEALNYESAHVLSAGLLGFSFLLLLAVSRLQRSSMVGP
jgi:molybdate transport system permease protein